MSNIIGYRFFALLLATICVSCAKPDTATQTSDFSITEANFAAAETAKNFRNWASRGANEGIAHMRELPPRGDAAPTYHDRLSSMQRSPAWYVEQGSNAIFLS